MTPEEKELDRQLWNQVPAWTIGHMYPVILTHGDGRRQIAYAYIKSTNGPRHLQVLRRAKGNYYQPDHWLSFQFPTGQGQTPVAGVRPKDAKAFCDWLTAHQPGE